MFEKLTKLSIYLDKSGNKKESYYLSEIIKAAGIKDLAKEEYGKMRELWEKDDDVQTAKDDALKEVVLNPDQEALREDQDKIFEDLLENDPEQYIQLSSAISRDPFESENFQDYYDKDISKPLERSRKSLREQDFEGINEELFGGSNLASKTINTKLRIYFKSQFNIDMLSINKASPSTTSTAHGPVSIVRFEVELSILGEDFSGSLYIGEIRNFWDDKANMVLNVKSKRGSDIESGLHELSLLYWHEGPSAGKAEILMSINVSPEMIKNNMPLVNPQPTFDDMIRETGGQSMPGKRKAKDLMPREYRKSIKNLLLNYLDIIKKIELSYNYSYNEAIRSKKSVMRELSIKGMLTPMVDITAMLNDLISLYDKRDALEKKYYTAPLPPSLNLENISPHKISQALRKRSPIPLFMATALFDFFQDHAYEGVDYIINKMKTDSFARYFSQMDITIDDVEKYLRKHEEKHE